MPTAVTPFLLLCDPARDAEVDQHHPAGVAVDHQVRRFQVAIDDRLGPRVEIVEHVGDLHSPIGNGLLIDPSADAARIREARSPPEMYFITR